MDVMILLLCGLPGAGKTTLARKIEALPYADACDVATWGVETPAAVKRVNFDELYHLRTDVFDPVEWKRAQEEMVPLLKERINEHRRSPEKHCLVLLVDDNFHYRSMRKRVFHLAEDENCGFGIIHINTRKDVCRLRNTARVGQTRVPDDSFERMVDTFEAPDSSHSFEVNSIVIEDNSSSVARIMRDVLTSGATHWEKNRLARCAKTARQEQQVADQQLTAENALHNFDLLSRKWISSVLNGEDPAFVISNSNQKAALARTLNSLRRLALLELKQVGLTPTEKKDIERRLAQLRDDAILDHSAVEARPLGD